MYWIKIEVAHTVLMHEKLFLLLIMKIYWLATNQRVRFDFDWSRLCLCVCDSASATSIQANQPNCRCQNIFNGKENQLLFIVLLLHIVLFFFFRLFIQSFESLYIVSKSICVYLIFLNNFFPVFYIFCCSFAFKYINISVYGVKYTHYAECAHG